MVELALLLVGITLHEHVVLLHVLVVTVVFLLEIVLVSRQSVLESGRLQRIVILQHAEIIFRTHVIRVEEMLDSALALHAGYGTSRSHADLT